VVLSNFYRIFDRKFQLIRKIIRILECVTCKDEIIIQYNILTYIKVMKLKNGDVSAE